MRKAHVNKHLNVVNRDPLHLDALQRLRNLLLLGGIEIVDTPIELEFLFKHSDNPIDTLAEKNRLPFVKALESYAKKLEHEPELKREIKDIVETLKTCPQNQQVLEVEHPKEEHHHHTPRPGH